MGRERSVQGWNVRDESCLELMVEAFYQCIGSRVIGGCPKTVNNLPKNIFENWLLLSFGRFRYSKLFVQPHMNVFRFRDVSLGST